MMLVKLFTLKPWLINTTRLGSALQLLWGLDCGPFSMACCAKRHKTWERERPTASVWRQPPCWNLHWGMKPVILAKIPWNNGVSPVAQVSVCCNHSSPKKSVGCRPIGERRTDEGTWKFSYSISLVLTGNSGVLDKQRPSRELWSFFCPPYGSFFHSGGVGQDWRNVRHPFLLTTLRLLTL